MLKIICSNIEIAIIPPQIARFDKIWHTAELSLIKPILQSLCYAVTLTFIFWSWTWMPNLCEIHQSAAELLMIYIY